MEQASPTYPGVIGVCSRCLSFQADFERAVIDNGKLELELGVAVGFNEQYVRQLDTAHKTIAGHEQTIAELGQQLRELREQRDCNARYMGVDTSKTHDQL